MNPLDKTMKVIDLSEKTGFISVREAKELAKGLYEEMLYHYPVSCRTCMYRDGSPICDMCTDCNLWEMR